MDLKLTTMFRAGWRVGLANQAKCFLFSMSEKLTLLIEWRKNLDDLYSLIKIIHELRMCIEEWFPFVFFTVTSTTSVSKHDLRSCWCDFSLPWFCLSVHFLLKLPCYDLDELLNHCFGCLLWKWIYFRVWILP